MSRSSNDFTAILAAAPAANRIVAENRLAGSARTVWDVIGAGHPSVLGFATNMSVDPGQIISFKIDCNEPFTVDIYRMGYYGGDGARLVATVNGTPANQPAPAAIRGSNGAVECSSWTINASWAVPSSAVPGLYIARPRRADSAGASHIPFVVRDGATVPGGKAQILVKLSDATWQAYNYYGGKGTNWNRGRNLYGQHNASGSFPFDKSSRAYAVSYDRPFVTRDTLRQTFLFNAEYPLICFLERNGYDIAVCSSLDVHNDPTILDGRKIVISSGHDEYWSQSMRDAVTARRDSRNPSTRANLVFMSGNAVFWRVRFTDRTMWCYKDTLARAKLDPIDHTGTWRDPGGRINGVRLPENELTGTFFIANGIRGDTIEIPYRYKDLPIWRNTTITSLTPGQKATLAKGSLGFEWDEVRTSGYAANWTPRSRVLLSETSVSIKGFVAHDDGRTYRGKGRPYWRLVAGKYTPKLFKAALRALRKLQGDGASAAQFHHTHAIIAYQSSAGNIVVGFGTTQWAWGLDDTHDRGTAVTDIRMQQATVNLLTDLGVSPPIGEQMGTLVVSSPQTYRFARATSAVASDLL